MEEILSQNESEDEEEEEFVDVNGSGLMLFKDLHNKLYAYQREGVAFLYSLYRDQLKGGILADDMGLGKTIQVISFLSGMYDNELAKHTLLVMPTSLITNWTKEFAKWTPGMRVKEFHGSSKGERTRNLEKVQRRSGVVITTYTMLLNNWQQLSSYQGREFTWDYMILDEAHKIKSTTTKTAKSAYAIPSKNRVLLTGTPVQNNLKEMWSLFDFACQGALLGTAKTFKTEYENPITRAREKDATPGERALGSRMSENLMTIIKPYFLRRTKAEVQKNKINGTHKCKDEESDGAESQAIKTLESGATMPRLTRKNDLIVWTYLSPIQEDIYRQFLSLDHIKELLMTTRSPLAELNILKKLCDHPRLLSAGAIAKLGLEDNNADGQHSEEAEADAASSIANIPDDTLISESGKLVFLFALLDRLREEGHRTLVFAHYRKVLDIIERILGNRGFKVMRLDGTITQIAEREKRISKFQTDDRYSVFLLTTQVGGVGITLTAASRVVIYDPSWNPATDAQAVDRAYRIGQTENVVIYRLITCGTVEEKIYRRQVFKDSLIRQNTGDKKNPFRYFSKQELKELFTLEDSRSSSTQLQLQSLHSRHRRTDPELDEHIAHLHTMEMFGISDHDLMFSLDVNNDEAPEDQEEHNYIEGRVQKAQELMKAESEIQMQLAESMASSTEPAWLRWQKENDGREPSHERKPRKPVSSPSYPQQDLSDPTIPVVDLDQSGSSRESPSNPGHQVIDLTADVSMEGERSVEPAGQDWPSKSDSDSWKQQNPKQEKSTLEDVDASPEEELKEPEEMGCAVIQESLVKAAPLEGVNGSDSSQVYFSALDNEPHLNGTSPSKTVFSEVLEHSQLSPPKNKRLSVLKSSRTSFKTDAMESLDANFNLQLEDSDLVTEEEDLDQQEMKLLSRLQAEGSLDVNKSLSERNDKDILQRSLNDSRVSVMEEESLNDSIVPTKKKRAAVIYDSEEEEEEADDKKVLSQSPPGHSLKAIVASTPKLTHSGSTPLRSRRSVGGNTSVASQRSLLHSFIKDLHDSNDGLHDEDESSEHSDEAEEENMFDPSENHLQLEETVGETLNTEGEEEEDDEEGEEDEAWDDKEEVCEEDEDAVEQDSEMSSSPEESTSEPELASSERMDECTVDDGVQPLAPEGYDSLVSRGRECFSQGELDCALDFFLRAIDIKPGDPEVQLMTIKLYRQLSQRS